LNAVDLRLTPLQFSGIPAIYESASLRRAAEFRAKLGDRSREDIDFLITKCRSCPAYKDAKQPVPPEGDWSSKHVVFGRNPGKLEDLNRRAYSPESPGGKMLTRYLDMLSIPRRDVYFTNSMFCHTLKDRQPDPKELATCSFWKSLEITSLLEARYFYLFGNDSIRQVLSSHQESVSHILGRAYWYLSPITGKTTYFFPLHHPSYIMRNPSLQEAQDSLILQIKHYTRTLEAS
jgi:uracil-DNA glycosylase family 4